MDRKKSFKYDHHSSIRRWEQTAPWLRKLSMRIGLEGKLILCFMAVLCAAVITTSVVFNNEAHDRLSDMIGEQAREVATALSLTCEQQARLGEWDQLNDRGQELIKSRNILFVGFLDANARPKALASRDLDFALAYLTFNPQWLMRVRHRESPTFGEYLEVMAPILSAQVLESESDDSPGARVLGYVTVGVSQLREAAQINRVRWMGIAIVCSMMLCSLPIALILIHRIFLPIRKLVEITKQIINGNMNVRTEVYRPDIIGELSRSFDEMVMRVKQHQEDLADANTQLADANRGLEEKIDQRTAQLATANNRLVSEIADKEEFLRAISHDLNAPLRNVAGIATMLLTKHSDTLVPAVVYRLERIKSNVAVQTDLIGELLELSRIKSRREKIEVVDVAELIEDLRGLFDNDLKSRAVELIVDTSLPVLSAERTRIRRIFQNLIDNAIKYMGDRDPREIHIGCAVHEAEVEFYVRDTGLGIDAEDQAKVFFIFRRGKIGKSLSIPGKGIGLASVKSIVETYNGKIRVVSTPGQGSTFWFTLNGKFLRQPMYGQSTKKVAA